jgi:peptide/nickel transport system substrate-binding protein
MILPKSSVFCADICEEEVVLCYDILQYLRHLRSITPEKHDHSPFFDAGISSYKYVISRKDEKTLIKNHRQLLRLSLVVVILLATVSSVVAQDDSAGKGGRFVIADQDSNTSLDPFVTPWHSWAHYALYPTLFTRDENLEYVGFLADTWEAAEDGLSMTIHLIDYATFSDGTPVNAEAIKWNLERYADPEVGAPGGADLVGLLTEVEVVDDYTVTLHLSSQFAALVYLLSNLEIVSPTAYEAMGPDEFGLHPVGAGPFLFKELNTDNYVLLERNPDFTWAPEEIYDNTGPVYLDEFQILFLSEQQTIVAALETGEIQYAGIPPQNLADIQANDDITVESRMQDQIRYVGFNTSKAPWDNPELRRAFAYATNREEFVILAWDEQAVPLYQPLPPTIWGHNPDLDADAPHYDPEKAASILDELGYVDADGDGVRDQPDGSKWTVPLAVGSEDDWRRQGEVLDAQWHDLGIPVELDLMAFSEVLTLTTTGEHDLFLSLYGYQDPLILTYFFDPDRKGGSNRAWYSTDELTALLKAADSDLNQETRYQKITEISQYLIDQSPWVFLCVPTANLGIRNELKNWKLYPPVNFIYWNAYFEVGD